MPDLGSIVPINLRELWPHEAQDFTPWLSQNLDRLGAVLGFDLELVETESCVGPFHCDIVAKEVNTDHVVIIENQLEDGDHSHLGQLLTYASGKDASIVVWIAKSLCDEYRQALTWLNQRTDQKTQFFGVVPECFRIDQSRPVVNFTIIVAPNNFQKRAAEKLVVTSSDLYERFRNFFQTLYDELRENHHFTNAKRAQPQNWATFSSGVSGLVYGLSFARNNKVRCEIYIDFADQTLNKLVFDRLTEKKETLEASFGEQFVWERLDGKRASRIALYRSGSINGDEAELTSLHHWAIEKLLKFKEVFRPILMSTRDEAQSETAQSSDDADKASG
jgi:hypothetical protein